MLTQNGYTKPPYPSDWSQIAYAYKEKNDWTCQSCGLKRGDSASIVITVHHNDHNTFNNDETNLSCLCSRCHLCKEREYRQRCGEDKRLNELQATGQLILPSFERLLFPQFNIALI